ncbi:TPA: hypothetical protein HA273_02370 [Candidatus Bathyarchaeota archaeon]|nr:hypothetical protein [Candidatus Bathyarchaeota archaeon]HIJ09092.1 hypothetical protein [Candidatus Bathyarchaeota archaeon]
MTLNKIDEYEVIYSSNKLPPRILLKAGNKFIGQLVFKPSGATLPQEAMIGDQVNLYFHLEDFQNIIDLLRNEKPLYILWSGQGGENGLKTTPEAVGEADGGW